MERKGLSLGEVHSRRRLGVNAAFCTNGGDESPLAGAPPGATRIIPRACARGYHDAGPSRACLAAAPVGVNKAEPSRARRRRGAALLEFVVCVVLFGFILTLTYFFGWAMKNQQNVRLSARYKTWREVHTSQPVDAVRLNALSLDGIADDIALDTYTWPDLSRNDYVDAAGQVSGPAERLAGEIILGRFPGIRRCDVAARFPTDVGAWEQYAGSIRSAHARQGVEWRRGQAGAATVLRSEYFGSLEDATGNIQAPGRNFAGMVQRLYHSGW